MNLWGSFINIDKTQITMSKWSSSSKHVILVDIFVHTYNNLYKFVLS